ncbi:hypothetical protein HDU98_005432 [Podochytrium sp. JEL0797]|nr:hypothetical protein HDU98_005432 [Podochytrium sp. JEL0797]
MREFVATGFQRTATKERHEVLRLVSTQGTVFSISVLDAWTVRVRHHFVDASHAQRTTHAVAPGHAIAAPSTRGLNVNITGTPRESVGGSGGVAKVSVSGSGDDTTTTTFEHATTAKHTTFDQPTTFTVTTDHLVVVATLSPGDRQVSLVFRTAQGAPFLEDLPHRAYPLFKGTHGARHFLRRRDQDLHYGLGERAAPLTLNNRRFRLETMDALGYNADATDPLYKLVPFHITLDTETNVAHGIYYDSFAEGFADFGQEIDAFWGPYRSHTLLDGCGLDMYVFLGPSISNVVSRYTGLVGRPAMPPKYALGYLASAMGYAESENAQALIAALPELCREWEIPCDLLHLSSGYTVDERTGARNVFTWNKKRFPDPETLIRDLRKEGIRVSANVKPWLLSSHPSYKKVYEAEGFIKDSETSLPRTTRLWSAGNGATSTGSYFDLSSVSGRSFWIAGVQSLLDLGIESIWNDNNEFSLPDTSDTYAHTNHDGTPSTVGAAGRGLQTLLMASASYEAMTSHAPRKRPFLITRSAVSGVQRFAAQSWSGDNYTSWETLKGNIPMGLNCGLSGIVGYGHDVGGFVGPRPGKELFVRWVQNGVFHPRFCIHSWKEEGVTEPWMYPEVVPIIRDAIHLRYKLLPYLYTLYHEAHLTGHPIIRPLVYEFQHDTFCHQTSYEFMLGPHLLIASVYEPGATTRTLRLPRLMDDRANDEAWCDVSNGVWYPGSKVSREEGDIVVQCPLTQCGVVMARRGAIVPTGPVVKYVGEEGGDYERLFWVFPPPDAGVGFDGVGRERWEYVLYEDDGESKSGGATLIEVWMEVVEGEVVVGVEYGGPRDFKVSFAKCWFVLPLRDVRVLRVDGRVNETRVEKDGRVAVGVRI